MSQKSISLNYYHHNTKDPEEGLETMKKFLPLLTVLFILTGAGVSLAADVDVQTGFEYTWWKDSENNAGYQAYVPLKISAQFREISVSILGGYAFTGYHPHNADTTDLAHTLDTKVNFSYTLLDKLPFDILLGLDFNIPTGKTNFSPGDLCLIMDPDLVPLSKLGEGFNINPTISIAKGWDRLVVGLGVGYVWRGKYDYATYITDYDPGDIFTVTAQARYEFSPLWNGLVFGQYARFGTDEVNGHPVFRDGDFYMGGAGLRYSSKSWDAAFTMRYVYRDKSEMKILSIPDDNINGNEWRSDLVLRYFWSQPTTLSVSITGLLVQENGFPESSSYYVGHRQKVSLELGWERKFGKLWETKLFVRGFNMHDEDRALYDILSDRTYNGFSVGGSVIARF